MVRFLVDLGAPRDRVLLETRSRNTYENVREAQRACSPAGIWIRCYCDSAYHMRRAQATFHAAEIQVIPAATDYEVLEERELTLLDFLPDAGALETGSSALEEYLGFWFYQWLG